MYGLIRRCEYGAWRTVVYDAFGNSVRSVESGLRLKPPPTLEK
jgi:hypothetical protein